MITDVNPFVYSRPVGPDEIIDRDDETQRLLAAAVGGHYVRLYAPRKYGKTTLLRRVLRDAEQQEGMIPILVDLYGVLSVADTAVRFERAYARQLKGKVRARIEEFLQSTGLGLSLGAFGIGAKLLLDPRTNPLPALHTLLDLPLRLEEGGGFRALIVLDEFQDITKVREMDALLRSHIQHQGEVASFVFAGSEPGLMRELFEQQERPLYGQAVPMRLERLADADVAAYIVERFRESGRSVGDALNPLVGAAQGHPQRAMLLAHRLWEEVEPDGHRDARRLDTRPRRRPGRAPARVRRELAPPLDERAEGAARRRRRPRLAVRAARARAARPRQEHRPRRAALARRDRDRRAPRRALRRRRSALRRVARGAPGAC